MIPLAITDFFKGCFDQIDYYWFFKGYFDQSDRNIATKHNPSISMKCYVEFPGDREIK